jgi:1,2-diacylglycerol 3-beta-galactosyltransferase
MGPIAHTAQAIADSGLDMALAIVTGRNERLRKELEARSWPIPVYIYGFTRDMPDFMHAADVLITKAGPGTIAESLNAHTPLILYSRLPGQEDGNVTYVTKTGVGIWAPQPERVVQALRCWITNPDEYQQAVEACRKLARPDSSLLIAKYIGDKLAIQERM